MADWLLILALCIGFDQTLGDVPICSQDFLFAVSQETGGVGLSLIFDNDLPYTSSEAQSHLQETLQGQFSSACGDNFFRCKNPLILTTQQKTFIQYLIFVPLEDGLLIKEVVQTGLSIKLGKEYLLSTRSGQEQYSCSPIKAFEIAYDYYLVCADTTRNYISLHRIFLNKTVLQETTLSSAPIAKFHTPDEDMQTTLSNPIYVNEGLVIKMIFFSVGNSMYVFDIVAFGGDEYGNVGYNCTHVRSLQYIGNSRLLAYCDLVNVYYSIQYEDWDFQYWNEADGVPYACPNTSIELIVFSAANYLRYSINDLVGNTNLLGFSFSDGVCFGAAKKPTMFAYSDLRNVYIINMETFSHTQVLKTSCTNPGCLSIDVINNRYLVIRENSETDKNLHILDVENDLSSVIAVQHYTPALFKFVNNVALDCVLIARNETPSVISFADDDSQDFSGAIAGAVSAVLIVVLVVIVVVGLIVGHIRYKRKRPNYPTEQTDTCSESGKVVVIATSHSSQQTLASVKVVHPLLLNRPSVQVQVNNYNPTNTSPIVATNTTATQEQVGNTDSDSHTMREVHQMGDILPAPSSLGLIAKGTNAATNYIKGSQDHGEWLERPKLQLGVTDNDQGKWENRSESESSHSSLGKDDNMPLLKDY
ncbi:uncharacterized protein LOC135351059 [Halichondria panicea]|uniref:uncharacterized protein LOC135351059 n=1 Tax=Halichondria panicea TaxID=6063 RepID=UPI00312BC426